MVGCGGFWYIEEEEEEEGEGSGDELRPCTGLVDLYSIYEVVATVMREMNEVSDDHNTPKRSELFSFDVCTHHNYL